MCSGVSASPPPDLAAPTPLGLRLAERIRLAGPLTVADYMAAALGDPEHGYYMRREPFGVAGDFTTAPEISQMFGELVGIWCLDIWRALGSPPRFRLVELGPGRGTLMADALRAAAIRPAFRSGLELHLVETSPRLREVQQRTLAPLGLDPQWHDKLGTIPRGLPIILIANEFFDALPIRQFMRAGGGWRERMVGLDAEGRLAFGLGPPGPADLPDLGAEDGEVLEVQPAANAVMGEIATRVVADGGALVAIDYGYAATRPGDTLQAVRRHRPVHPLAEPGLADLTAHVNFEALARTARAAGADVHGPVGQGEFLLGLGLLERAGRLGAGRSEAEQEAIGKAVERLAGPGHMGTLFKALVVT